MYTFFSCQWYFILPGLSGRSHPNTLKSLITPIPAASCKMPPTRMATQPPSIPNPIIGGSCLKYHFCRVRHDKHMCVATKKVFCHDKSILSARKRLSRQKIILVAARASDTILAPCRTNPEQKGAAAITHSCVVFVHVKHHVYFNPLLSSSFY